MRISRGLDWPAFAVFVLSMLLVACCARVVLPADRSDCEIAVQAAVQRHQRVVQLPDSLGNVKPLKPTPRGEAPSEVSIEVASSSGMVATLQEVLGSSGSLILRPTNPITIQREAASVRIAPNTLADYSFSSGKLVFAFPKPKPILPFTTGDQPTIDAKVWKFSVHPKINYVELRPDDKAMFDVGSGLTHRQQTFDLKPLVESPPKTTAAELPKVILFVAPYCSPCLRAKAEIAAASDLPFEIIERPYDEKPKHLTGGAPLFWWSATQTMPDNQHATKTKVGFTGLKDFIELWRASRKPTYRRTSSTFWDIEPHSRERYITHLLQDGIHRGKFRRDQLDRLTDSELLDLHSDDHEGRVQWERLK